jgi:hypothetical protein
VSERTVNETPPLELVYEYLPNRNAYYAESSIRGRVRNNSDTKYRYVQVSFNTYDGAHHQIGNVMANIGGLEPGRIWEFTIKVSRSNTRFVELDEIVGW